MSRKHPKVNARQLIKILEQKGFTFSRQSGSHAIYIYEEGLRTTVPIHGKKELGIGLLKQIMKDTDLSIEDLENL
ncbi:type II toxin-antitoxin system HicA family toxin [Spirosoma spitsbergense]|uniref:type II toxin-antitoxin system HicA family toxin n=1 Tax=Spirosoma spitsbergense TaxID=431554 RepID=UPI00037600BA|nr:type II toxin-antitoxin system HicA family toxin [Spirosoma spitsbergense]